MYFHFELELELVSFGFVSVVSNCLNVFLRAAYRFGIGVKNCLIEDDVLVMVPI